MFEGGRVHDDFVTTQLYLISHSPASHSRFGPMQLVGFHIQENSITQEKRRHSRALQASTCGMFASILIVKVIYSLSPKFIGGQAYSYRIKSMNNEKLLNKPNSEIDLPLSKLSFWE